MTFGRWKRILAAVALVLMSVTVPCHAQQPKTPAQEGFVPVDQLPPDDQLPAAPLLIAAYAIAWVAVLGYLWSIWRRLAKVERELADVSRRVEAGGRR